MHVECIVGYLMWVGLLKESIRVGLNRRNCLTITHLLLDMQDSTLELPAFILVGVNRSNCRTMSHLPWTCEVSLWSLLALGLLDRRGTSLGSTHNLHP